MTDIELVPDPLVALLGYTLNISRSNRRLVSLALLLGKQEIALHW